MRRFNPWFEIPGLKITLPRRPLLKLRSPTFPRRLPALTGCLICPGPTRSRARAFPTSPASSAQIPPTTAPILKFQASKCSPRRHLSIAGLTLLIVARCRLSRKTTQLPMDPKTVAVARVLPSLQQGRLSPLPPNSTTSHFHNDPANPQA
ncbi:hypothetical protein D9758_018345 [Tetrapyrgos nigripes]|uniref:Uncharacterized protein n=1 Tax=Tetrapyrgos nigripes TaxID=182062 RepID=A0A8H5FAT4_9AGAR|nr:hypothetical protein D9758_018345 [Tetrapyrgos nigripes]